MFLPEDKYGYERETYHSISSVFYCKACDLMFGPGMASGRSNLEDQVLEWPTFRNNHWTESARATNSNILLGTNGWFKILIQKVYGGVQAG